MSGTTWRPRWTSSSLKYTPRTDWFVSKICRQIRDNEWHSLTSKMEVLIMKHAPRTNWRGRKCMLPNITAWQTAYHCDVCSSTKLQCEAWHYPPDPKKCIQWVLIYKHLVRWTAVIIHTLWHRVKPDIVYAHGSMHNGWLNSRTCEGKRKQMGRERMDDGGVKEREHREKSVFYVN